ncbi:hypothetical protein IQ17_03700 [Bradyrhizobium daqingense]|uniref:Uncharacterized protein n=2 Tax=Bradyrhizobium daqingense TaxID=993502 RepID=A0A562L9Z0_9BRAD|nr:hypothetical protein IQ17_03700 [Bradyrhizobium daqingense]
MTLQMCEEAAMAAIALQAAHRRSGPRSPSATLKPLDPDVLGAAIPAFFIGRNSARLWVGARRLLARMIMRSRT